MKQTTTMLAIALSLFSMGYFAQAAGAATKDDLRSRCEERYNKYLKDWRAQGKIGETISGTVEAVKGNLDEKSQKVVDEENADRKELYQLLAKENGTTAAKIAQITGEHKIKELRAGEYYKDNKGWHEKS